MVHAGDWVSHIPPSRVLSVLISNWLAETHLMSEYRFSWVEVSGLPRGALVEWHIVAGLPDTADSDTADGESGVKRAGGVGEDNPLDMDDVISELRYDKSKLRDLMLTCSTENPKLGFFCSADSKHKMTRHE